jgi:hypothetical protein
MVAACCCMVALEDTPAQAIARVRKARCDALPKKEQQDFVYAFAKTLHARRQARQ